MEESTTKSDTYPVQCADLGQVCPPRHWEREDICDTSIISFSHNIRVGNRLVECTSRYRVERCTLGYVLSDLLHSMTLFPGEQVFLSNRTRHSIARFTEDQSFSASQVSRSSDRIWMESFKSLATDFSQNVAGSIESSSHSAFQEKGGGGGASLNVFGIFKVGGGGSRASGTFDESSTTEFFQNVQEHLRASVHQTNQVSRDTMSVSLTEVNSHREATAERNDELKVSTRRFKNINHCHTVTHYFYQIAKRQRVRIELIGRTCRALNRYADSAVVMKDLEMSISNNLKIASEGSEASAVAASGVVLASIQPQLAAAQTQDEQDLQALGNVVLAAFTEDQQARTSAVAEIDSFVAEQPTPEVIENEFILPTEAVYVESELGSCMACEPYVIKKQELELERLCLENRKLKREAEILEKHRDYRCCGEQEEAEDEESTEK